LHDLIWSEPLAETVSGGRLFGAGLQGPVRHLEDFEMIKFVKKDDGLVTIEWVGIAAVMVLAAIAVTAFIMQSASNGAAAVGKGMDGVATSIPSPMTIPFQAPGGPATP
jgi:hypothetical protein